MLYCEGCGMADPPDYIESHSGHVYIDSDHHPDCDGYCTQCPISVQRLCGPVVEEVDVDATIKGYPAYYDDGWFYCDTKEPAARDRPCNSCGKIEAEVNGVAVDPCVGYIEGALNACCGHGVSNHNSAYIMYPDKSLYFKSTEGLHRYLETGDESDIRFVYKEGK